MVVQFMFYLALIICTATVIIVAVKGFLELMAPIKAEKAKKLQQEQNQRK